MLERRVEGHLQPHKNYNNYVEFDLQVGFSPRQGILAG